MRRNSKGFAPIFITVLLVFLGAVFYLARNEYINKLNYRVSFPTVTIDLPSTSPMPSPASTPKVLDTSVWNTYTNTTMGFSVKLPQGWFTHKEQETLYGYNLIFSYPVDNSSSQDFTEGQIASIDVGLTLNNKEDVNKIAADRINMPYSYLDNKEIETKVDGENAIILVSKDNLQEEVIVVHKGKYYLISVFTQTKDDQIRQTFNQILSTFKFTD